MGTVRVSCQYLTQWRIGDYQLIGQWTVAVVALINHSALFLHCCTILDSVNLERLSVELVKPGPSRETLKQYEWMHEIF